MPTINVNGATISYTDTETPNSPTIVFGHGLLFSGWMFRPQLAELRSRYRCVTIDWRGQGATPATATGYDMDTLTGDAVALIRQLGGPVHFAGLSMGGFIGQRIAARHGELLRSLILLDTSAGPEEPGKRAEYKQLAWFQQLFGLNPVIGKIIPKLFGPAFLADPANRPLLDEWATRLSRTGRTGLRRAVFGVADRRPIEPELPRITVPTLVVVGADDRTTPPARAERIASLVPGAQLEVLPNCGHSSPLEQPAAVTSLLAKVLES